MLDWVNRLAQVTPRISTYLEAKGDEWSKCISLLPIMLNILSYSIIFLVRLYMLIENDKMTRY